MLITMINGFNLLSESNVLSFCCQNPARVSTHSLLPLQVPIQVLAAPLEPRHLPGHHHHACLGLSAAPLC